jgi:hypothetical protein
MWNYHKKNLELDVLDLKLKKTGMTQGLLG